MRTKKITPADIDTISASDNSAVFADSRPIEDGTEIERTLVGTLVPGAPITIKDVDWSFTAEALRAAEPVIAALEHELHGADACAVAWLYARI